jgi:NAD(P)-dependent dehydrogenase (short-subunit alcohol dehydrogenase family)
VTPDDDVIGLGGGAPGRRELDGVWRTNEAAGMKAVPKRALPALTKGGLVAASRSLAIEYASRGVRVNAVSLGVIKTPDHDPASYDGVEAVHPLGRLGEVSDVVDAILYLERATFVTGETLHVDGGQAAGR